MAKKVDGVRCYAEATVKIYFPEGNICCDLCPMLQEHKRKQCARTGEYILDSRTVGHWCPLEICEEIKEIGGDDNKKG